MKKQILDTDKIDLLWEQWAEEKVSEKELILEFSKIFNVSLEKAEIIRNKMVDLGEYLGEASSSFLNEEQHYKAVFLF